MEPREIRLMKFGLKLEIKDSELKPEWLTLIEAQLEAAKKRLQRRMDYAILGMDEPQEGEDFKEYLDRMECSSPEFRDYIEAPVVPQFNAFEEQDPLNPTFTCRVLEADKPNLNHTVYPSEVLKAAGFFGGYYGNYPAKGSSSGSTSKSDVLTDEVKFNGSPVTDVISANEQTGEIHYYERHWHTHERIPDGTDPTGYRTCREKGKVEVIKKPTEQPAGDSYNPSDDYYKNNPWFPGGYMGCLRVTSSLNLTLKQVKQLNFSSNPSQPSMVQVAEFTPVFFDGTQGNNPHYVLKEARADGDDLVLELAPCKTDGSFELDGTINAHGAPRIITVPFRIKSPQLRVPNVQSDDPLTWPANTVIEVRAGTAGAVDANILQLFSKLT